MVMSPNRIGEMSECSHATVQFPLLFWLKCFVVVFLSSLMWLVNPKVTCTFNHKDKLLRVCGGN